MKKRMMVLALAGLLAMTSLTGCSSLNNDEVVVTVDDKEITAGVANFYARFTQAQYETYYAGYLGEDMWNTEASEGETYEESVKNSILEELETLVLLEEHMADYEIELTDAEKEAIEKTATEFDEANALEDKEKVSGDKEVVNRVLTLMAIQEKMSEAIQAEADTEVSDEEAAQKKMQYVLFAYTTTDEEGNSVEMTDEEKAEVKSTAEAFAEAAASESDFAKLATDNGVEATDLTFDAADTSPSEELIQAADALEENQATGVIETDTGCYVAKVTSLLDKDATETEKESIVNQRRTDLYNEVTEGWRDEADIDVNNSVWSKIDFNDLSVTMKIEETDPYADEVQTDDVADSQAGSSETE